MLLIKECFAPHLRHFLATRVFELKCKITKTSWSSCHSNLNFKYLDDLWVNPYLNSCSLGFGLATRWTSPVILESDGLPSHWFFLFHFLLLNYYIYNLISAVALLYDSTLSYGCYSIILCKLSLKCICNQTWWGMASKLKVQIWLKLSIWFSKCTRNH